MPRITDTDLKIGHLLYPEYHSLQRPTVRSECPPVRPCPFIGCRYNLYLDNNGDLSDNSAPWEQLTVDGRDVSNCSLDVAAEGGKTPDELAAMLGVSRQRVEQIIAAGLEKLRDKIPYSLHRHLKVI